MPRFLSPGIRSNWASSEWRLSPLAKFWCCAFLLPRRGRNRKAQAGGTPLAGSALGILDRKPVLPLQGVAILNTRSNSQGGALGWNVAAPTGRNSRSATSEFARGGKGSLARDVIPSRATKTRVSKPSLQLGHDQLCSMQVARSRVRPSHFGRITSLMSLHPIKALDHVIAEYRDYLRTEFRAKDLELRAALERELDAPRFLAQEPFYQAHRPFKQGKLWSV